MVHHIQNDLIQNHCRVRRMYLCVCDNLAPKARLLRQSGAFSTMMEKPVLKVVTRLGVSQKNLHGQPDLKKTH
jgi:hypothetical protein